MAHALQEQREAVAINPTSVVDISNLGLTAMYAGDFATGVEQSKASLALNSTFVPGFVGLGLSQLAEDHPADAIATYEALAR